MPELSKHPGPTAAPLPHLLGLERVFRLRWVMEFQDKPTRRGMWDLQATDFRDMAAAVPRSGLAWAVVEGEHIVTHETVRILEVPARLFESFQWLGAVSVPGGGFGLKGPVKVAGRAIGLALNTDHGRYEVYCDGRVYCQPR